MNNLKHIIENKFKINFNELNELLDWSGGIISGGLPLMCYVDEITNYDGDMDIFIRTTTLWNKLIIYKFSKLFCNYVKKYENSYTNTNIYNLEFCKKIKSVISFNSNDCNIIQIIFIGIEHTDFLKCMDFSFCATWWDGSFLQTLYPDLTSKKQGFIMNDDNVINKNERLEKYGKRGFNIDDIFKQT